MTIGFIIVSGIMFLVALLIFCSVDYNHHSMVFAIIFIWLIVASYKALEYLGVTNAYYLTYIGIVGIVIYGLAYAAVKIRVFFEIKKYRDIDKQLIASY